MGPTIEYEGVTFANVRAALAAVYFMREGMTRKEWAEALRYVIPMQHNFENPIEPGSQDTWIQFWIDEDDRYTQDYNESGENKTLKRAHITVRFLGRRAETWAKAFHHLAGRVSVPQYFAEYCNGVMLEYVSPIVPRNVDYFGVGNTTVAHDVSFDIKYVEKLAYDWTPFTVADIVPGDLEISRETAAGGRV